MNNHVFDWNPYLFKFGESGGIHWYGAAYVLSWILCFTLWFRFSDQKRILIKDDLIVNFGLLIFTAMLLGGRLGYVLLYEPKLLTESMDSFPYWGALDFNRGGLAAHGCFIAHLGACYLFARRQKVSYLHILDMSVIGGSIGIFFVRLANFLNGELLGTTTSVPWGLKFPKELYYWIGYDLQLAKLKALGPIVVKASQSWPRFGEFQLQDWNRWVSAIEENSLLLKDAQNITVKYLKTGMDLVVGAVQNKNTEITAMLSPLLELRHPAPLYGAIGEGLIPFVMSYMAWKRSPIHGMVAVTFTISYAIARFVLEFWKLPNADAGYSFLHMTHAQLLSISMFLVGICLWIYIRKINSTREK